MKSFWCCKPRYEDNCGLPDDMEREVSESRRPAWIEQRAQFIERRLKETDYRVHVYLHYKNLVVAEVPLHQAGISARKLRRVATWLGKWDWMRIRDWGDTLLQHHLHDFEMGIADVLPQRWERAVKACRHRYYGLLLLENPSRMAFVMYPSVVADAINSQLRDAAKEIELH